MAGIPLSRALDGAFLEQLKRATQSASDPQSAFRNPVGNSSTVTLGPQVLRDSAKLFSRAVQNFNGLIFTLNETEDLLSKVGQITDDLIGLTTEAAQLGTSKQKRSRLENKFRELATDFTELVESTSSQSGASLNKDDLQKIFTAVGLSEETSAGIAAVFEQFVSADGTNTLASKETKAAVYNLSSTAFGTTRNEVDLLAVTTTQESTVTKLGNGYVTDIGSVFVGSDEINGYNLPDINSVIVQTGEQTLTGLTPVEFSSEVLAVNETDGSSLIKSTNDFLGYNTNNGEQLFLVNSTGNVVAQITNFAGDEGYILTDADISSDNSTVVYSINNADLDQVFLVENVSNFANPSGFTLTSVDSLEADASDGIEVALNNEGTYFAYRDAPGGNLINLVSTVSLSDVTQTGGDTRAEFGFFSETGIAYLTNEESSSLMSLEVGGETGIILDLGSTYQPGSFAVLQSTNDGQPGAVAVADTSGSISYFNTGQGTDLAFVQGYDAGFLYVDQLSLAHSQTNQLGHEYGGVLIAVLHSDYQGAGSNQFELLEEREGNILGVDGAYENEGGFSINFGAVTSTGLVFQTQDSSDLLGYNDGVGESVFGYSFEGITDAVYNTISNGLSLLAVSESSGFFVGSSSDDYLGYNSSGFQQLYLFDHLGRAVAQITDNFDANLTYTSASISASNRVAFTSVDDSQSSIGAIQVVGYGTDPALNSSVDIDALSLASGSTIDEVKISNSGQYLAYSFSGTKEITMVRTSDLVADTYLSGFEETFSDFEFIGSDTLALVKEDGLTDDIVSYQYGSSTQIELIANVNDVGEFAASEKGVGRFEIVYEDRDINTINVYEETRGITYTSGYDPTSGESIGNLSINNLVKIGIGGTLPVSGPSQASGDELYSVRIQSAVVSTSKDAVSPKSVTFESVLDPPSLSRRNALQLKEDLNALRDQIDQNLEAVSRAKETVGTYLEFFRDAGKSLLDLSNQITSDISAEQAASKLVTDILRNSDAARSGAADALESVTVATLLFDDSSNFFSR